MNENDMKSTENQFKSANNILWQLYFPSFYAETIYPQKKSNLFSLAHKNCPKIS